MSDRNRLKFHIIPENGWMNDPNGLCQFQGIYHIFFQQAPDVDGRNPRGWGHVMTRDFVNWKRQDTALSPDEEFDRSGAYSGSALIHDGKMHLFYTGNVKYEGDFDYIVTGREANTVRVESEDGIHFGNKEVLMTNTDYPADYTCHVRDPKVWEEDGRFYMVQGGRKQGDRGGVLVFSSEDLKCWEFRKEVISESEFGYMWECPDYFKLQGNCILSFSPQGLAAEKYQHQNVYQSGYLMLEEDITKGTENIRVSERDFTEWDMGFDFYAPQTFLDEQNRRILIGWAGMPEAEYDNEPTKENGWQHALTIPRELRMKQGKIYQVPIRETKQLRQTGEKLEEKWPRLLEKDTFELKIIPVKHQLCEMKISCGEEAVSFTYDGSREAELTLTKEAGRGRKCRKIRLHELTLVQIYADTSLLEIFLNEGEAVMTTRYYFPKGQRILEVRGTEEAMLWELGSFQFVF